MGVNFQIGQCRVWVDVVRTEEAYKQYPMISDNCGCGDCIYFQDEVIRKDIRLFKMLRKMGVDLSRQPNASPDGVNFVGPSEKYKRIYIGYYKVFGILGKTQKGTHTKNANGKTVSVEFFEPGDDSYTQYKIIQESEDELIFSFYVECEKVTMQ